MQFKSAWAGLLCLVSFNAFAADLQYSIVVDAGSSGSRVHIFEYDREDYLSTLRDVYAEKTEPGLSSYAAAPQNAGPSLKSILDNASAFLKERNVALESVKISVLATAGMRLLTPSDQSAVYQNLASYLRQNYAFQVSKVETIDGKMEGIYGWLDVNHLAGHFVTKTPTVGSIDMGGASTQIAFATSDVIPNADDEITLTIDQVPYKVFSKSFLGMGVDQSTLTMSRDGNAASCYVKGYEFQASKLGAFDFDTCADLNRAFLDTQNISESLPALEDKSFVAYSAIYSAFKFMGVDGSPSQEAVQARIKEACGMSWDKFLEVNSNSAKKYLPKICATSVYNQQLLFGSYKLTADQILVTDKIQSKGIDWALGAALYELLVP